MGSRKTLKPIWSRLLAFFGIFLDGWTLIDPSNNLRGGFEGSVIFTYSIEGAAAKLNLLNCGIICTTFGNKNSHKSKRNAYSNKLPIYITFFTPAQGTLRWHIYTSSPKRNLTQAVLFFSLWHVALEIRAYQVQIVKAPSRWFWRRSRGRSGASWRHLEAPHSPPPQKKNLV